MQSLIYDLDQAKKFYDKVIDTPREAFDADFFCVAARKKYMTQEDRERTRLGDTCMMKKTALKQADSSVFLNKLRETDAGLDWLTSLNGEYIPRSCMVFYMNVNHTNMAKGIQSFKKDLVDLDTELSNVIFKHAKLEDIGYKVKNLANIAMKAYQDPKNVTDKTWIDLDLDVFEWNSLTPEDVFPVIREYDARKLNTSEIELLETQLLAMSLARCYVIKTHGGLHILVSTAWFKHANKIKAESRSKEKLSRFDFMNLEELKHLLETRLQEKCTYKEFEINQNMMVPIPGTLQGGVEVKFYEEKR